MQMHRYCKFVVGASMFTQVRNISYKKVKSWYAGLIEPKPNDPPYGHIVQIGDPILRTVSDTIPLEYMKSPEISFIIAQMKSVFKRYSCVGLSAPQIGAPLRIVMFEYTEKHAKSFTVQEQKNRNIEVHPFTVIINPEVKITDYTQVTFPELCESVRGFCADVPRYRSLQVKGYNPKGEALQLKLTGWNARIIQHEIDHINGVLYTDIMNRKTLTCTCWEVVNQRRGKVELPYGTA